MVAISEGARSFPFSEVVLARSLTKAGLEATAAWDFAAEVGSQLRATKATTLDIDDLRYVIADYLDQHGLSSIRRRLRVRWWIRARRQPLVIAVGGSSGVGKSTVSQVAARRLGIDQVFSTDMVRSVVRATLNPGLLPALSGSSFSAEKMLRSNLEGNRLLWAFEQQATVVGAATVELSRRMIKEGLQVVINGVHIVPGLVEFPPEWPTFQYVLTVADIDEHRSRFESRMHSSSRPADDYVRRLEAIRELDAYIVAQCRAQGVPVVESTTFDATVLALVEAICSDLEARFDIP